MRSISDGDSVPGCHPSEGNGSTPTGGSPGPRAANAGSDEGAENFTAERTHLLTDVAPEHPVPHGRPQLPRYRPAVLDGQVRDAAARVHHRRAVGSEPQQCTGRTRVHARGTRAAVVAVERRVVLQLDLEEQRREEDVRAAPRVQQHRIAAVPAQPRTLRQLPLQHRTRVDVRPRRIQAASRLHLQPAQQRQQPLPDHRVVVAAARVPRDDAAISLDLLDGPIAVAHGQHQRAAQLRPAPLRIEPRLHGVAAGEVAHRAVPSGGQPRAVQRRVVAGAQRGHAGVLEAQGQRLRLQALGQRNGRRLHDPFDYPFHRRKCGAVAPLATGRTVQRSPPASVSSSAR
jgi:hypothetical protein